MVDAVVQVPPIPGTSGQPNQQIDTSQLTRSDGTVLERQRVSLGDPVNVASLAAVNTAAELLVHFNPRGLLTQLKRIAMLLEIIAGEEVSANDVSRKQE